MASKWIAEKMGDMVEDAVKKALGMDNKDEDKDEDEGGIFSKIFNRDDDDDKKKRKSSEKDDDEGGGIFSKIFNRDDDDDDKKERKSGFSGLFSELEGAASAGDTGGGEERGGEERGGASSQTIQVNDGDLFDDLMDVAQETERNK